MANEPINWRCCRGNCFGFKVTNLFHSDDQLEEMLHKNFDGRRLTVKAFDQVDVDCMFFPFSEEQVLTKAEMKEDSVPEYLGYPTIIFFNPNA